MNRTVALTSNGATQRGNFWPLFKLVNSAIDSVCIGAEKLMDTPTKEYAQQLETLISTATKATKDTYSLTDLRNNKKKISNYANLPMGWNGYNAQPISTDVVERALEIVGALKYQPKVFPTGRNSIQFEFKNDSGYLELEISQNEILFLLEKGDTEAEGNTDVQHLEELIDQLYA